MLLVSDRVTDACTAAFRRFDKGYQEARTEVRKFEQSSSKH